MRSLKLRLLALWALSLAAGIAVGLLLVQLSHQTSEAQAARAEAVVARACGLIEDRYDFYAGGWTGPAAVPADAAFRADLTAAVSLALARQDGVEGGIWQADAGPLAYASPTYGGSGPKTDLPAAERDVIAAVNAQPARDDQPTARTIQSRTGTLLLHACPLEGPVPDLTAWTMARVQAVQGVRPLQAGLAVLLGLALLMSAGLDRLVWVWGRHVRGIEAALSGAGTGGMPAVERTGEQELDRIVDALNDAGRRLGDARRDADALAARVARAERLAWLSRHRADAVLLDLRMPGLDGIEVLRRIRTCPDAPPVAVLTAVPTGENTIEAMRLGAADHLAKPIGRDGLRALLARMLPAPGPDAPDAPAGPVTEGSLIGSSAAMRDVQKAIGLLADSDATVLLLGETGSGKEGVARTLHRHGRRAAAPFVPVNCAAIPAELLESLLFGHVRGAFTGAVSDRTGSFREAHGGTLFLDEIGDMTLPMQAKLLRVLQERVVTPVGGRPVTVDVRVVAATHRDLQRAVRDGRFREDLYSA